MTRNEITALVIRLLGDIAPEANFDELDPQDDLREAIDIDSMDFLNFVIALSKELSVEVPEVDYPKLSTFDECVDYIQSRQQ